MTIFTVVMTAVGLFIIIKPEIWFKLTKLFTVKDTEMTPDVKRANRILGLLLIVIAVASALWANT